MKIDGIELLRKYRDKEIDKYTKIKSLSTSGNVYDIHIGDGADKILYENNTPVSTGYLTNKDNEFEIIEEEKDIEEKDIEEKDIEELDLKHDSNFNYYITNEHGTKCYMTKHSKIIAEKVNELVKEINKLKKEAKNE